MVTLDRGLYQTDHVEHQTGTKWGVNKQNASLITDWGGGSRSPTRGGGTLQIGRN